MPHSVYYTTGPAEISGAWDVLMASKFAHSYCSLLLITKKLKLKIRNYTVREFLKVCVLSLLNVLPSSPTIFALE